jgi:hypothetical protein
MSSDENASPPVAKSAARDVFSRVFGSSGLGVGIVLVIVPALLLVAGLGYGFFDRMRLIGLPLMAILGIVLLFGTLALVAMLFQSLGLTDKAEPLALPPGSIRAAIALSLIVLFAIISIMLFQSMVGQPYLLQGFTKAQMYGMVERSPGSVIQVVPAACAASVPEGGACAEADERYDLHLQGAGLSESASDLATQLLTLVGTLMTSVTSFYFATRGQAETKRSETPLPEPTNTNAPAAPASADPARDTEPAPPSG